MEEGVLERRRSRGAVEEVVVGASLEVHGALCGYGSFHVPSYDWAAQVQAGATCYTMLHYCTRYIAMVHGTM